MTKLLLVSGLSILVLSSARAQVEPDAGSWRTWVISDLVSAYRLAPPPSDAQTRDEAEDLKILATQRDEPAINLVRFWDAGARPYRWIQMAQQEVATPYGFWSRQSPLTQPPITASRGTASWL